MRLSYVPPASNGSSTPGASQIVGEQTIGESAAVVPTPKVSLALQYAPHRRQTGKEDVSPSWVLPKETLPTLAH